MFVALGAMLVAASAGPDPYLTFSRSPAFDHRVTIVDIGSLEGSGDEWGYWFRRSVKLGKATSTWWTDSKRCPAARWVVEHAIKVPSPQLLVPGVKDPSYGDPIITADGVGYTVQSMGHYGGRVSDLSFNSNVDTPLAEWVDESLRRLEPCWSKDRPSVPML
jgi:hypothetical protein